MCYTNMYDKMPKSRASHWCLFIFLLGCNLFFPLQIYYFFGKRGKVKSSSRAYDQRETQYKQQLGMDPDTSLAAYECAASQSMDPWVATKKALHQGGGDTSSCPVPYPVESCPECHVDQAENFSPCPHTYCVFFFNFTFI